MCVCVCVCVCFGLYVCAYFYQSIRWIFLSAFIWLRPIGMPEAHSLKFKIFSTCGTSFLYLQRVGFLVKIFAEHIRRQNERTEMSQKNIIYKTCNYLSRGEAVFDTGFISMPPK